MLSKEWFTPAEWIHIHTVSLNSGLLHQSFIALFHNRPSDRACKQKD